MNEIRIPFRNMASKWETPPRLFDFVRTGDEIVIEYKVDRSRERMTAKQFADQFNQLYGKILLKVE